MPIIPKKRKPDKPPSSARIAEALAQLHADTSKPTDRLQWIGKQFDGFHRNGQGYKALCPCHDDAKASLCINTGKDGGVVMHCQAGCLTNDVLKSVGLRMADLMPNAKRIIAEYDYRDAEGSLLYQSVRYDPKDFRQRKPDGTGWCWKGVFDGISRVPYRLPDLAKLKPGSTVFIVEGEKDADRLASLRLNASTNVGGAGKWREEYSPHFKGLNVVILPDNDEPGMKHGQQVANALLGIAASVRILELPDLPEKGDVSDWLDAGGTLSQLLALAKCCNVLQPLHTRGETESDPLNVLRVDPLQLLQMPVEPFPVDAFPRTLQGFILSASEAFPCPPDFIGTMILPILASIIGRKRSIRLTSIWTEFPTLWVALVARSGERKTPVFKLVTEPLRKRQKHLNSEYAKAKAKWDALSSEQREKTVVPRLQQTMTTDSTVEGLKTVLTANPNGILFAKDELSGWARSMGQYKGGLGDDRQNWLSLWSGEQIISNRAGRDPIIIDDFFVSVTGGIQPDVLGDLVDRHGREDGFEARILFSFPDPLPPSPWNENPVDPGAYPMICDALWELEPSNKPLSLSKAAKAEWARFVTDNRIELSNGPDNLRSTWSKFEGQCARIALVLYETRKACNETRATEIDLASMQGAIALISYFKSHARRVYGKIHRQRDTGRIGLALDWIKRHGGTVTAREVNMHRVAGVKGAEEAKELLSNLQELGHGTVSIGQKNSVVFTLTK